MSQDDKVAIGAGLLLATLVGVELYVKNKKPKAPPRPQTVAAHPSFSWQRDYTAYKDTPVLALRGLELGDSAMGVYDPRNGRR